MWHSSQWSFLILFEKLDFVLRYTDILKGGEKQTLFNSVHVMGGDKKVLCDTI